MAKPRKSITIKDVKWRVGDEVYVYLSDKYKGIARITDVEIKYSICAINKVLISYNVDICGNNEDYENGTTGVIFYNIDQEDIFADENEYISCNHNGTVYSDVEEQIKNIETPNKVIRDKNIDYKYSPRDYVYFFDTDAKKVRCAMVESVDIKVYNGYIERYYRIDGETYYEEDVYKTLQEVVDNLTNNLS